MEAQINSENVAGTADDTWDEITSLCMEVREVMEENKEETLWYTMVKLLVNRSLDKFFFGAINLRVL